MELGLKGDRETSGSEGFMNTNFLVLSHGLWRSKPLMNSRSRSDIIRYKGHFVSSIGVRIQIST